MHLNVGDVAKWYAERYPDVPFGSLVPGVCYYCFADLSAGDRVELRNTDDELDGQIGVIDRIAADPKGSGSLYFVTANGDDRAFIRSQLIKHRDKADIESVADTEPGYF
jgi:hypothetical protein